jgi:predicted AlkP superfamily phosphohydrolase/phosphomutase/tetratricopeptide (TPR) repeat protein
LKQKLLLIGWDAADWKVIQPLLAAGQMPNLARLIREGISGNLATIYPVLSPMLWTSIATGKRPYKHGIHGFTEPLPDRSGVRPVSLFSRKCKAIWNILNQNGKRSLVVGWWPSHPAEPINGVMVSNHFQRVGGLPGKLTPVQKEAVHPDSFAEELAELRVHPMELEGDFIRMFVPEYEKVDQAKDKRLHSIGKIIAETMTIHAVATELLETESWDFGAIYYDAIDHFGHAFMSYHPPRLPSVSESDFEIYQHVIANAYRYHDAMLGTLLRSTDEQTTVILMSDHGFHPDHLRPAYIPAEPAGPALEHRHFGILCAKGPALRVNEKVFGASVLDICPTILTLFGLAPGRDMDGKVLLNAFREQPKIEPIETWETVPGDAGLLSMETRLDPIASAEAFKQLVDLGYVAPPAENVQLTIDECICESKYNLARAWRDANYCREAAVLAQELWDRWPREHRFGILLLECLAPLQELPRRREAIAELERRIKRYQDEACAELARREQNKSQKASANAAGPPESRREQFEARQLRELAHGRPLLIEWFYITQALLEKKPAEAREYLRKLQESDVPADFFNQKLGAAMAQLGDFDAAIECLRDALGLDPENPIVHAQLAAIHFNRGRFDDAIAAATESLSLMHFQPGVHAILGRALMAMQRFAEAEQELLVAVSQSPRNLVAHETLGRLYREHLNRPHEAFAHEGRALSLRQELALQQQTGTKAPAPERAGVVDGKPAAVPVTRASSRVELVGKSAAAEKALVEGLRDKQSPNHTITIVSGLPRSGTSMMMQILVAAGREALTDCERPADDDNPLGYFEYRPATNLAKDVSWLPLARGKVVKVVAQLLPALPRQEDYKIILMERDLTHVIASQTAMLARRGRSEPRLPPLQLIETYERQLRRVLGEMSGRAEAHILRLNYEELLAEPKIGIARVAEFLGVPFDEGAAVNAIRPELWRQKGVLARDS